MTVFEFLRHDRAHGAEELRKQLGDLAAARTENATLNERIEGHQRELAQCVTTRDRQTLVLSEAQDALKAS